MKVYVIGLLLLCTYVFAQQKGRILVSATESSEYHLFDRDSLEDALKQYYPGEIVTQYGPLPDTLNSFDAVYLMGLYGHGSDERTFTLLKGFLDQGGLLYFESNKFFYWEDSVFSYMIGTTSQVNFLSASDIDTVYGSDGYFTAGLRYPIYNRKLFNDSPDILVLEGPREQVLYGAEAFQYQTDKYKVVFHRHLLDVYYKEFIGRVACNYFGLCEPLLVGKSNKSGIEFTVAYDPFSDKLIIEHADGLSTLAIYNTLGVKLFEKNIFERTIEMPDELPAGNYFMVATGVGRISTKGIIVWK
jgi:hypothetical protein